MREMTSRTHLDAFSRSDADFFDFEFQIDLAHFIMRPFEESFHNLPSPHRPCDPLDTYYSTFAAFGHTLLVQGRNARSGRSRRRKVGACIRPHVLSMHVRSCSPLFFYYYHTSNGHQLEYKEDWNLMSIFLVFPLTLTLTSAFHRRDEALTLLALFRSSVIGVFLAHKEWDWYTVAPANASEPSAVMSGRALRPLPSGHMRRVHGELLGLIALLQSVLRAPPVGRLWHYFTLAGRVQRSAILQRCSALRLRMTARLLSLSVLMEPLKAAGMPGNEASWISFYVWEMMTQMARLINLKRYRTPAGLRAYCRLYILVLPVIYGPCERLSLCLTCC